MVLRTLVRDKEFKRVEGRLARETTEILVKRLGEKGYQIVFKEGEKIVGKIVATRVGLKLSGRVAGTLVAIGTSLYAGGQAYAESGDLVLCGDAALRDFWCDAEIKGTARGACDAVASGLGVGVVKVPVYHKYKAVDFDPTIRFWDQERWDSIQAERPKREAEDITKPWWKFW